VGATRIQPILGSEGLRPSIAQERLILTESQLAALAKAKAEKEARGEFESECPGYCGAQDTFYVGTLKGVGRVYQQTFIDTHAKVGVAKLYDRKTPIIAGDLLNEQVLPFDGEHEVPLLRILTDRGTRYWGIHDRHEHGLYLAVEYNDHRRHRSYERLYPGRSYWSLPQPDRTVALRGQARLQEPRGSRSRRQRGCRSVPVRDDDQPVAEGAAWGYEDQTGRGACPIPDPGSPCGC
jgi:hypothetical protein